MHGTSTASSMAEVANSLIGEEYVQALDMPLTMKAEDMLEKAKKKIKEIYNEKGILLLVDMGSLVNFGDIISNELEIKIKTIDMVTTLTVIEAGSKAFNGRSLDSIYNLCRDIGKSSMQVSKEDYKYNKELVIITTCFTGEGAAERIKIRISNNLKNIEKVKIIPLNISDREEFFRKVNRLKEKFVVLAVVGTINIVIENVQFIPAQDVFLNEGINYLENLVDIEYDFLKVRKALSIELNELNSIKVFSDIRDVIRKIEENLKVRIQHDAQIGILIHITFLIDKLKHGGQELKFKDLENYRHMYNSEFSLIKKILKDLERVYNINIGDNEIAYIVRIVKENIVTV
jgi:Transcriptional antiterminator